MKWRVTVDIELPNDFTRLTVVDNISGLFILGGVVASRIRAQEVLIDNDAVLSAIKEIADKPVNAYESPEVRVAMIARLIRRSETEAP